MSANTHIQLPFTTSHAFIVGINDYQHLSPLSTAVNDAKVIAERLADQHGFTVHPPLLNATHQSLRKLLTEDIPKLVGKDDRVLFYFAGHGIALDGEEGPNGYLVAADTRPGKEETLISMQLLHNALTELPCRHGLLILDCCFSGAFKWSSGFRDVIFDLPKVIYEERFWRYCKDPAWQVITSSAHDQKAVDIITNQSLGLREEGGGGNHSPFANSLLKALAGDGDMVPAGTGDGVMTATEIYSYLRDSVENQTTENAKRQSPSIFNLQRHDKGEFIFLNPNHRFNLPPTPDRNPFMGLSSFNEADANLFYGRDRVVTALLDKVKHQQLIVVSGASGTGKSSVIKAGVLPQLRKQGYTVLPIIRPGKEPLETIAIELPDVEQQLNEGSTVLVIDQYEELITQCLNPEHQIAFEQQIANWLQQYPQLRILLSIRSDFEPQFESETLAPWWLPGRYVVPTFSLEEIREVITKPAAQAVLFYEPEDLVEQLSEEVGQAPGALPLLSFTLSELYHKYLKSGREDRALTESDYNELGGVIGALRTRADAEYKALNPEEQSSMRKLMLRMVSLEGGELAGKRVYTEELQFTSTAETGRLETIANRLVDARLLLKGTDGQGRSYIEPAHDALVRAWGRLWEWIKTVGEEKITLQYKLSQAVNDYHSLLVAEPKKARNLLWNNNPRLDLLNVELQGKDHGLNAQEEAFVRDSVQLRSRRKRTNWGIAIAVMIGLAGLSIYSFIQTGVANTKTQEAQSAGLGSKALVIFPENNTAALNIANLACQHGNAEDARTALFSINSNPDSRFFKKIGHHGGGVNDLDFSPGGDSILTASQDGRIILWSTSGQQLKVLHTGSSPITSVSFSSDGKYIISGGADGVARIMQSDGKVVQELALQSPINSTLFIQDRGSNLGFAADEEGNIWRFDLYNNRKKIFDWGAFLVGDEPWYNDTSPEYLKTPIHDLRAGYKLESGSRWGNEIEMSQDPASIHFFVSGMQIRTFEIDFDGNIIQDSDNIPVGDSDGTLLFLDYDPTRNALLTINASANVEISCDLGDVKQESYFSYPYEGNEPGQGDAKILPSKMGGYDYSASSLPDVLIAIGEEVIWFRPSGQEKLKFATHKGGVNCIEISKDGKYLITGGVDGSILLWPIQPYFEMEEYNSSDANFSKFITASRETQEEEDGKRQERYQSTNGKWELRLEDRKIILSRDDIDFQEVVEPQLNGFFEFFAMSDNGQFIYTKTYIANATGEDLEIIYRKWPNHQYEYENGLITPLSVEDVLKYNIPEAFLPFIPALPNGAAATIADVKEQLAAQRFKETWNKSTLFSPRQDVGSMVTGVRDLYRDMIKETMSLQNIQELSPVPVFLKGPHDGDFNLQSEEFGHYNPAFLDWVKEHILPAKEDPVFRATTQSFFDNYLKDIARSYYLAYRYRDLAENVQEQTKSYYLQELGNVGETHLHVGGAFWNRRHIDTTAPDFFTILTDLLTTYDEDWLNAIPKDLTTIKPRVAAPSKKDVPEPERKQEPRPSTPTGILTGDNVRVRQTPVDGTPLFKLSTGDQVEILDQQTPTGEQHHWYRIRAGNQEGWIRSDFVKKLN